MSRLYELLQITGRLQKLDIKLIKQTLRREGQCGSTQRKMKE